jgi:hypothetical protein
MMSLNAKRLRTIILLWIAFYSVAFTGKQMELTGYVNARSGSAFEAKDKENILFTLAPGTKAKVIGYKRFPESGNYGLEVIITSGPRKGAKVWVYYNLKNPNLKLSALPEVAEAAVTIRPTPATAQVPRDLASPNAETAATGVCTGCITPAPSQSFVENLTEHVLQNPLAGAKRVMAALYQSCEVLNLPPYDPRFDSAMGADLIRRGSGIQTRIIPPQNLASLARNHFYLKPSQNGVAPQCSNMQKTPPIYHYGGRPSFNGNEIDLFQLRRTGGAPFVGIDCSAFVSSALSVAGLKLTEGVRNASSNMATSHGLFAYHSKNSCFNRPQMTAQKTIQPGDVIAYPGHTYMIDEVGDDPFGFAQARQRGKFPSSAIGCHRFEVRKQDLDFTIIQSSGYGDMPAMRIRAKDYYSGYTQLRNMAVQACLAHFGQPMNTSRLGSVILRHKGAENPKCVFTEDKKPSLRGEQCTGGCKKDLI